MAQIKALGLEPRNIGWSVSFRVEDEEYGPSQIIGRLIGVECTADVVVLVLEGFHAPFDVKPETTLTAYPPVTQSILSRVQETLEDIADEEAGA